MDSTTSRITSDKLLSEKIIPPIEYENYQRAKFEWLHTGKWPTGEDLRIIVCTGNYWGSVLRTTYRQVVYVYKIEPFYFWNSVIKYFILHNIWVPDFAELLKTKEAKQMINKMTYPEWVPIGLMGCDWEKLRVMCEKWCNWYDRLDD